MSIVAENTGTEFLIRRPRLADAPAIHGLIVCCPPLDTNSLYCNLLQCAPYAETRALAESNDGRGVGFVSSYRPPERRENLFDSRHSSEHELIIGPLDPSLFANNGIDGLRRVARDARGLADISAISDSGCSSPAWIRGR